MLSDAEKMIDEVVAYTKSRGLRALLGSAQFARGQILVEEQKFPEALEALRENRENSTAVGDPVGIAAANLMTCFVHVAQKNFSAASAACRGGDSEFASAKRMDLALTLRGVRAEVLLGQGHVAEALAGFSGVLGMSNAPLPLFIRKRLLLDQADALQRLGRSAEAYDTLHQAYRLEQDASIAQRLRTVAVLRASAESERLLVSNRLLEQKLAHQKDELSTQQQLRRMSVTITAVVVLVALLLAYLLLSARKHGRELRRQEAIVSTVASHAPDALVLLGADRQVRFCNRNLFGGAATHPVGLALRVGVPGAAMPALDAAVEEVFALRRTISFSVQLPGSPADQAHYELVAAPVIDDDQLVGAVLRSSDVTAVRRLEREVIDVSSRERQRLSADLHDGLGQELTGVMLLLKSLLSGLDRGTVVPRAAIAELAEYVSMSIATTREIARGLSPVNVERGSLRDALDRLARESSRRLGIAVSVQEAGEPVVVAEAAGDHLYRIASEGITNAARHADCSRVDLELRTTRETLSLIVRDDGRSPVKPDRDHDGLGLKMMAYRARLLGGSVRLEPTAGGGSSLIATVALAQIRAEGQPGVAPPISVQTG
jgi:signal transduction histidine kinase